LKLWIWIELVTIICVTLEV